ncbi:histone deacetylase [Synechococcus sp. RSCCF101]|uniref:histone deacetylase family protein n=1 Tax=Synechococcus sp. RSCCF101 TaxID=2511069 RepID=UPI0012450194|nr:histone deacetylase [Synechococcus sp. RSCCF101]QEY33048.1 histone deacetylase [Synechococcus sp. RSCCF101]
MTSASAAPPTGLLLDARFRDHLTPAWHPEAPARIDAIAAALRRSDLAGRCRPLLPRPASDAELERCHSREHVARVEHEAAAGRRELSSGDTPLCPASAAVARLAAGGVLNAVDAVLSGQCRNAFAAVRPPGHHASRDVGMGFCLYNNIALAARHAQQQHGLERVLIVDWDVHHGNGTQAIFWDDPSVLVFGTHQELLYPMSGFRRERGAGAGLGTTINCPLRAGSDGAAVLAAVREQLLPAADAFAPQLVLISAGFDAAAADPLADFQLTAADFGALSRLVLELAERLSGGRLLSVLEGGYHLPSLAAAVEAHVAELVAAADAASGAAGGSASRS